MNEQPKKRIAALVGQPNCGKSTLFNKLTGIYQHIANYPGVTVEKKTGRCSLGSINTELYDLPGTYSLTAYSPEETVTRNELLSPSGCHPELVINTADACALERHLFLTLQLIHTGCPVILFINKIDSARAKGISIDTRVLEKLLHIPVITGSARTGEGIQELCTAAQQFMTSEKNIKTQAVIQCSDNSTAQQQEEEIKQAIEYAAQAKKIAKTAVSIAPEAADSHVKKDSSYKRRTGLAAAALFSVTAFISWKLLCSLLHSLFRDIQHTNILSAAAVLASCTAAALFVRCCTSLFTSCSGSLADKFDTVLCHRAAGPLILLEIILLFYHITVSIGYKLSDAVYPLFRFLRSLAAAALPPESLLDQGFLRGLLLNGIFDGAVMIFTYIPIFACLFALVAILEDTGYMARIAFMMDRLLRKFGLHGQSTLPMILSGVIMGGCVVPGIMATRIIKDKKARLVTILILPLLSCMAKIPFYTLVAGIFFRRSEWIVLGAVSLFSLAAALGCAALLSAFVIPGEPEPFILELPEYSMISAKSILMRTADRLLHFIKKVGTIVVAVSALIWIGITFPRISSEKKSSYQSQIQTEIENNGAKLSEDTRKTWGTEEGLLQYAHSIEKPSFFRTAANIPQKDARILRNTLRSIDSIKVDYHRAVIESSFLGLTGKALTPLSRFAGIDWQMNVAVLSAFAAKEALVSTLGTLYSVQNNGDLTSGENPLTPLDAIVIIIILALFPPCIAAVITIRTETGSTKWTLFSILYPIVLGYIIAVLVYQIGMIFL